MKLYHVVTGLLAGAVVCFISGAEASPHFQAPVFSPLPLQAGLKCGLVNGELKCGDSNSSGKHHDDNDDQQVNDDDHHHKKKKNNGDDTGLSECTIQGANSGGGCKGGFKYVCEKLKSGKKCCGCVGDKNAAQPQAKTTKTSCNTIERNEISEKLKEGFKNACTTNHPGGNFNCAGFETKSECCCYWQE